MGRQLKGATLGIIGYGVIGQHLAGIGEALGMRVLASDPYKTIDEPGIAQVPFEDASGAIRFRRLPRRRDRGDREPDERRRLRPHAADGVLHQPLARQPRRRAGAAAALDAKAIAGAAMDVGRAPDQMPSLDLAAPPRRARDAACRRADARRRSSTRPSTRCRRCGRCAPARSRRTPSMPRPRRGWSVCSGRGRGERLAAIVRLTLTPPSAGRIARAPRPQYHRRRTMRRPDGRPGRPIRLSSIRSKRPCPLPTMS